MSTWEYVAERAHIALLEGKLIGANGWERESDPDGVFDHTRPSQCPGVGVEIGYEDYLNGMGSVGWGLVASFYLYQSATMVFTFKREKVEEPSEVVPARMTAPSPS